MIKLQGAQKVINNLRHIRTALLERLEAELFDLGGAWWSDTVDRLTFPFQAVPSYISESRSGLPGRKKYPKGTKGTFAIVSPSLKGTPWESIVQEYAEGPHVVADKLSTEVTISDSRVEVGLGYSVSDESSKTGKIVKFLLFGTDKMQPRDFLSASLSRIESQAYKSVADTVQQTIEEVVLE